MMLVVRLWFLMMVLTISSASANQCYGDPKLAHQALLAKEAHTQAMSERININTATAGELATLTGVGAKTAYAIIEYRQTHGVFTSIDDLVKVKGIGQKTLEKNRHRLSVY